MCGQVNFTKMSVELVDEWVSDRKLAITESSHTTNQQTDRPAAEWKCGREMKESQSGITYIVQVDKIISVLYSCCTPSHSSMRSTLYTSRSTDAFCCWCWWLLQLSRRFVELFGLEILWELESINDNDGSHFVLSDTHCTQDLGVDVVFTDCTNVVVVVGRQNYCQW